jgi:hypothetical protein
LFDVALDPAGQPVVVGLRNNQVVARRLVGAAWEDVLTIPNPALPLQAFNEPRVAVDGCGTVYVTAKNASGQPVIARRTLTESVGLSVQLAATGVGYVGSVAVAPDGGLVAGVILASQVGLATSNDQGQHWAVTPGPLMAPSVNFDGVIDTAVTPQGTVLVQTPGLDLARHAANGSWGWVAAPLVSMHTGMSVDETGRVVVTGFSGLGQYVATSSDDGLSFSSVLSYATPSSVAIRAGVLATNQGVLWLLNKSAGALRWGSTAATFTSPGEQTGLYLGSMVLLSGIAMDASGKVIAVGRTIPNTTPAIVTARCRR